MPQNWKLEVNNYWATSIKGYNFKQWYQHNKHNYIDESQPYFYQLFDLPSIEKLGKENASKVNYQHEEHRYK